MLNRLTTMLPAALLVLAAAPSSGHAETFCVVAAATDQCANTDLQDALDAAAADPGADVVAMGTGTFAAEGRFHYEADDATNPVEIAGQGPGTVLRAAADGSNGTMTTLSVGAPGSLVRDLRVEAVADPQDSADAVGLFMLGGTVQDVAFGSDAGAHGLAVLADGTTFRRIEVDSGLAGVAVIGATIEDSRFSMHSGIMAGTSPKPTTIRRSRIEAATEGIGAYGSVVDVHDTVVRLAVNGVALRAQDTFDYPGAIRGRHVTLVGPGAGVGAKAAGDELGGATVTLANSVMTGFATPGLRVKSSPAVGPTGVALSRSVLPAGASGPGVVEDEVVRIAAPAFVDAAAGDYTLAPGSPALDLGGASPKGGLPPTDLLGRPRPADGDGDGVALPDPGAFERPAAPEPAPADPAPADPAPGSDAQDGGGTGGAEGPGADATAPAVGSLRLRLRARPRARFTLSEPAQVTVTLARKRGGRFRPVASITRARAAGEATIRLGRRSLARPGRYRVAVSAADAAGNVSPIVRLRFRVR